MFADWLVMAKVITDDMKVKQGQEERNVSKNSLWLVVGVASSAWSWRAEMDTGHREVSLCSHLTAFQSQKSSYFKTCLWLTFSWITGGEKILECNPAKKYHWGQQMSWSFSSAVEQAAFNGSQDAAELLLVTDLAATWSMLHFCLYTRKLAEVPKITL